jgi:hypothetical protein
MIRIKRGREPATLRAVRETQLDALRRLGRPPASKDIDGYRVVATDLWKRQHYKCCYCERKLSEAYSDVEHYRPKSQANRLPGCSALHGYWWLAFTWANLLFACPVCNRSQKNDQFPLSLGDIPLRPERPPPGRERPLLLDPAAEANPVVHIEYRLGTFQGTTGPSRWWARPRGGSKTGAWTIRICGLNEGELPELRSDHVELYVMPYVSHLRNAMGSGSTGAIAREHGRALGLLNPRMQYVALSYDSLRHYVPDQVLKPWGLEWPPQARVGM